MKKSPACAGLEELVIVIPIRPVAGVGDRPIFLAEVGSRTTFVQGRSFGAIYTVMRSMDFPPILDHSRKVGLWNVSA
ncbi:MAG: hypothetical protein UX49_C0041G0004 [Candidatus Wolfebacteria bacterium GW2011_GWC2_46_275]|uniref:Uncharacterized protein n=1 Tax=Candidatus Wolfebacteria bacterium GW2011_GWB1_47_1 TaxID=1619007 RepID=A0A0G4ATH2_9BACT|nr:MAG: hypothetical protein UX70_C0001G0317 [Candidatus Wolfebacteria bacterium GW2011_GWB1_47_1]KKU34571.1 MAG: hypothetical protein UX49_C0041G0004 [Candidatus Wolfebacteria bacterium GW2011_GWC2_46_275]KKU54169.1 MAG: hypothetical protein UX76_C0005G0042 [Candidatus Wolfebacteria bacterium GW2011_GWC1_47_103]HAL24283.1 hypothetical protein [Candidatus Wolfebacteria bacterium]